MKKIRRAILSVSNKEGIAPFAAALVKQGAEIISTGGTAAAIAAEGIPVTEIHEVTGFPEMLGGRVRTLHPRIFGGILGRRSIDSDLNEMKEHGIAPIDLVTVNFYPFQETVAQPGVTDAEAIEKIDIGGPTLIRSAAKSYADVAVLSRPNQYEPFLQALASDDGVSLDHRRELAANAFRHVSDYDDAIRNWFDSDEEGKRLPAQFGMAGKCVQTLRYGENPHQAAGWYLPPGHPFQLKALQGKELSYNNLLDGDGAWRLIREFDEPTVAIMKHGNPCGAAMGDDLAEAFRNALACDPVSAFGGIVAVNRPVTGPLADELAKLFLEVIIAEEFDDESRARLAKKKNLRLVEVNRSAADAPLEMRSTSLGLLVQEIDQPGVDESPWRTATSRKPDEREMNDLRFAWRIAKHVRSNAIVFVKDGKTVGVGAGQMSRVDSAELAIEKAKRAGLDLKGSALASDGFFPFPDGVEKAAEGGAASVIQPGGSIRDEEVIAAADKLGIAMVLTSTRHFRH